MSNTKNLLYTAILNQDIAEVEHIIAQDLENMKGIWSSIMRSSLNSHNESGYTPLQYATLQGNKKIVDILLSHPEIDVNNKGVCGKTAAHLAIQFGKDEVLESIVNTGQVDFSIQDEHSEMPLLHYSVARHNISACKILIKSPDIDPNIQANDKTALHYVVELHQSGSYDYSKFFDEIIHHPEIDPNKADSFGRGAISYIETNDFDRALEYYFTHGNHHISDVAEHEVGPMHKIIGGVTGFFTTDSDYVPHNIS